MLCTNTYNFLKSFEFITIKNECLAVTCNDNNLAGKMYHKFTTSSLLQNLGPEKFSLDHYITILIPPPPMP